ncbi:MAG TPA: hypothetical protein VNL35_13410 [Chloroflexota bacterium]|nr:hypothetical protein [Chloroflexota bacterium]
MFGIELLEHIRLQFRVVAYSRDDLLPLVMRSRLDEIGELRGMQSLESVERQTELRRWNVPHERLDARPVNHGRRVEGAAGGAIQYSLHYGAGPNVDPRHPPSFADGAEGDVGCMDEPTSLDLDDLMIEDVSSEEHLAFPPLESQRVHDFACHPHPARGDLGDLADRDEDVASANPDLQTRNWRVAIGAQPDDQIVNAADRLTSLIDEWSAEDLCQAKQGLSHGTH